VKPPCVICKHMLKIKNTHSHHKLRYAKTCCYPLDVLSLMESIYSSCLGYGLDEKIVVWFLSRETVCCLLKNVHSKSRAHPASYSMGSRSDSPDGKATRARSWPLTSKCRGYDWVELYLHSTHMPSRHGQGQLYPVKHNQFTQNRGVWFRQ
jgi:hypothetical protein